MRRATEGEIMLRDLVIGLLDTDGDREGIPNREISRVSVVR